MNDVIRERLKTVPNRPGCYLMRDRRGVIIYVGKAKNLRRRVLSYFRPGADLAPKVRSMVHSVADLEFMTVKNDASATSRSAPIPTSRSRRSARAASCATTARSTSGRSRPRP